MEDVGELMQQILFVVALLGSYQQSYLSTRICLLRMGNRYREAGGQWEVDALEDWNPSWNERAWRQLHCLGLMVEAGFVSVLASLVLLFDHERWAEKVIERDPEETAPSLLALALHLRAVLWQAHPILVEEQATNAWWQRAA